MERRKRKKYQYTARYKRAQRRLRHEEPFDEPQDIEEKEIKEQNDAKY
jgi:hypothetical protein